MHFRPAAIIATHDAAEHLIGKIGLQLGPGHNAHLPQVGFANAGLTVDLGQERLGEPMLGVAWFEFGEAVPGDLDVVDGIVEESICERATILIRLALAVGGLQVVSKGLERPGTWSQYGGRQRLDVHEVSSAYRDVAATVAYCSCTSLSGWSRKLDECRMTIQMPNLQPRAVAIRTQLEGEATPHDPAPR